jgi:hypothetical protein
MAKKSLKIHSVWLSNIIIILGHTWLNGNTTVEKCEIMTEGEKANGRG